MSDKQRIDDQLLRGAWAHLTIPSLVDTASRAKPERRSFADSSDIANWSDLAQQSWTTSDLAARSTFIARQLLTLGLQEGDPVLVAMPNQVDGVATLLGVMLAGLVPCPVSVVASAGQLQKAAETAAARAIITVNRYAHLRPSNAARDAAGRFYGIRFVCAFGPDAPEGIISLDGWTPSELWQAPLPTLHPAKPALLTLDMTGKDSAGEEAVAHKRSHAQLISEGLALSAVSGLSGRGSIIATFSPVSAAGFVATVAAPLISGAAVTLHGPFDVDLLGQQLELQPEAIVVLPQLVEAAVRFRLTERLKHIIVISRSMSVFRPTDSVGRITEFLALGEVALLPLPRDQSRSRQKLPRVYPHPVATALPQGVPHLEMSISGKGLLSIHGFGVARPTGSEIVPVASPFETRWMAHGDGPDNIVIMPDENAGIQTDLLPPSLSAVAAA
jgi:mycobactin salicyl-AMP ligase